MDEVNVPRTGDTVPRPVPGTAPRRLGPAVRWAAGIGAVALIAGLGVLGVALAGGGTGRLADAVLTSGHAPSAGAAAAAAAGFPALTKPASVKAGPWSRDGAAASLHRCLAPARRLRATGHVFAARARLRACLRRFAPFRGALWALVTHALHGQITFSTPLGARTLAFSRGVIQSAGSGSVVVKTPDGGSWTWTLTGSTIVTRAGRKVGARALAAGQRVVAVGQSVSGTDDARRIFILG